MLSDTRLPTHAEIPVADADRAGVICIAAWGLLCLLFGTRVGVSLAANANLTLSLSAMAPLAAAWAVQRFGPRVIAPLAALTLVPSLGWGIFPALSLHVGPVPLSFGLLGIVGGALFAAGREPELWRSLVHRQRAWLLLPALGLLWLGRFEWPPLPVPDLGFGLTLDVAGGLAALTLVCCVNWAAVAAQAVGESRPRGLLCALVRIGLPTLLVAATAIRAGVNVAMFSASWGSAWSFGLFAPLCLLGLISGVVSARAGLAEVALLLAVEALRLGIGLAPLAALVREVKYPATLHELAGAACDIGAALLLAWVLQPLVTRRRFEAGRQQWLALGAIVLLMFVVAPLVDVSRANFYALGTAGWLTGGAAFAAALARGARGLVLAPLVLAASSLVAGVMPWAVAAPPSRLASAAGVAAVAAMAGFIGMLVRRALSAEPDARARAGAALDISRLAHFVRRLDTSATLRSFVALLVVVGVGFALVQTGVMAVIFGSFTGPENGDGAELALAWLLALPLVLAPLAFIVLDGINRQDRWRPAAALSGAVLAAAGMAAAGALLGGIVSLPALPVDDPRMAALATLLASAAVVAALAAMLVTQARPVILWLGSLLALTIVAGLASVAVLALRDPDADVTIASIAVALLALGLSLALWVRAVRLRADLAGDVPRALLFGEIAGGGFWARLACLMGLPASLWQRAALRTPAFWAFLLARPLVYAGAIGVWQGHALLGALAVVGGHLAFAGGKRLAAREIWLVDGHRGPAPVLFLRSFEDDQFELDSHARNPVRRWLALWSFRRNLDETMVDEVARYGPVVALGRPGETNLPFGAARHYSSHGAWQDIITETARRAHTVVIVAGDTPGVHWEYALLARERLLDRSVLLFRPGPEAQATNRAALAAFPLDDAQRARLLNDSGINQAWVALLHVQGQPLLLSAETPDSAAYVLALRAHFQRRDARTLVQAARAAPPRLSLTR